jgi:DNA-directed RNA polymerase specialized sigma24 family protein
MADRSKLDWIYELPQQEFQGALDKDMRLIYNHCSMDTLLDLLEHLPSLHLYISQRPLDRLRRLYILENFEGNNHKELAAKLGCSMKFVYQILREKQQELFEEEDGQTEDGRPTTDN